MKVFWYAWSVGILFLVKANGQTIPVGTPYFDEALRRAQLLGRVDTNVSFMIRPVDPLRNSSAVRLFYGDLILSPTDTVRSLKFVDTYFTITRDSNFRIKIEDGNELNQKPKSWSSARIVLLPLQSHFRINSHHPYGWADGAMVPAKGPQLFTSGGVFVKVGPLEMQYRPEFVWARNDSFQNPPFRARGIDMPERMGQESYQQTFLGQSYAKLHFGPIAVGVSNENLFWGPGVKNSIILSNNAPGFRHTTVATNKPVRTKYGTIEGQMIMGRLKRSGFIYPLRYQGTWPPVAANVIKDTADRDVFHSYVNMMQGVWQPKWTPGLFLGVSRVVQVDGAPIDYSDYFRILYLSPRGENTGGGPQGEAIQRNQLVSVSMRYLLAKSHAEFYVEVGREDWWWDFEDLLTRPKATTVWMAGFRKLYMLSGQDRWLQVFGEMTEIQAPLDNFVQTNISSTYSFYTHSNGVGWTNRGQVMGAGIGPGSNMATLGVSYGKGFDVLGLSFERVAHNEDLFFSQIDYLRLNSPTGNPLFLDFSKHYVDWGIIAHYHKSYGKMLLGYQAHALRTYNFQWNYSPTGTAGPFRFPGINVWSLNLELSMLYRF